MIHRINAEDSVERVIIERQRGIRVGHRKSHLSSLITEVQGRVRSPILDEIRHKMVSARTAHDFLGLAHGQRIQTSAFFRDDGTGGLCRVWSYIILHSSRSSW